MQFSILELFQVLSGIEIAIHNQVTMSNENFLAKTVSTD